ncbi:MAG: hypothetical protein R3A48_04485 [Polyangiales bacterium]
MSSIYRDERESLLASVESLRRENEDLRVENLALRVLVDPTPSRDVLGQLQGAVGAMMVLVGAMLCAAVLSRDPASGAPRARATLDRAGFVTSLTIPTVPRTGEAAPEAPAAEPPPALDLASTPPGGSSALALRAALRPLEPELRRCLAGATGDFKLRLVLGEGGAPRVSELTPRGAARGSREALRCGAEAGRRLRFDAEPGAELRYTLRAAPSGLRVRRARRR